MAEPNSTSPPGDYLSNSRLLSERSRRTVSRNLQEISTEIPDGPEFRFKPFISFAAKHPAVLRPPLALHAARALAVIGENPNRHDHRQ
jgi:hypothetical protein